MNLKTKTQAQAVRICAAAGLAAIVFGAAGCATASEAPGATSAGATTPTTGKADFYAEWYDATAVVLPPPPVTGRR